MTPLSQFTPQNPLLLIGGGKMGGAMLSGWLKNGLAPDCVVVADPSANIRAGYDKLGVRTAASPDALSGAFRCTLFATKPQVMGAVLDAYSDKLHDCPLGLSVAAGLPISFFSAQLPSSLTLVRAMPNTPAAVGAGITAIFAPDACTAEDKALCEALLTSIGEVVWLDQEAQMDAVTGVSGSGPAYVFHMIEAMTNAAVSQGLSQDLAVKLATQTVYGAGKLAALSDESAEQLRINVTSPNGTTQAGLDQLMDASVGLEPLIERTVAAAADRSRELSRS